MIAPHHCPLQRNGAARYWWKAGERSECKAIAVFFDMIMAGDWHNGWTIFDYHVCHVTRFRRTTVLGFWRSYFKSVYKRIYTTRGLVRQYLSNSAHNRPISHSFLSFFRIRLGHALVCRLRHARCFRLAISPVDRITKQIWSAVSGNIIWNIAIAHSVAAGAALLYKSVAFPCVGGAGGEKDEGRQK